MGNTTIGKAMIGITSTAKGKGLNKSPKTALSPTFQPPHLPSPCRANTKPPSPIGTSRSSHLSPETNTKTQNQLIYRNLKEYRCKPQNSPVWLVQGAAIYINIAAPCTTEIHTENQHFTLRVKPRVQPRFLHRLLILCFSCNPVIPKNKKSPKHFPFSVKIPIFASVPRAERSNAAKPAQLPNRYRLPNFLLFKSYLPTDYKKTIVFDEKTWSLRDFSHEELFLYGCILNIVDDAKGNLWFASQSGLYQSTPEGHVLKKYDTMNSVLTTNAILCLCVDSMNRLWVGSKFGLFLLDIATGKMRADCFSVPIKAEIKYIMEDLRKDMWVCTDNGLYKIGKDLVVHEHFTTDNLLPDNQVPCILEDSHGIYWIATQKEIVRYNPIEEQHYTYQRQDGLSGLEFNNSVFVSNDSIIWWANEGGLVYTTTGNINTERRIISTPIITSYAISNIEYDFPYMDMSKGIELPSSENTLRFKFSNMDYALPYANFYEYKLEGYDKEWLKQTGINEVSYKDLPGGHYVFKLRVPGGEKQMQTVDIYVRKSYTFMAGILLMVLIISILVIYFCYRIWKLKKRMTDERMILSKVQERSKDKKAALPEMKVNGILDNLLSYLEHEKPYLNPKLSIGDVAAKLDCTETELSQLLNNHMNVNFSNFINVYRVNEIKKRLNQENLSKYTLKALSEQCGFSSKATFYRVFKNVTGMTPLEYCKKQNLVIKEN
ncbi:helix-turn-helix domain-containing protein [Bacteroides ovatus]|nr:helix-turn-helix domain-containing protein [Bacteroides ovatus]MDC2459914.1 helix-turn-helix domain-containing protein [Bacteroides ovatus]